MDESGLTQVPTVFRTWAPVGQTPVLTHVGSWKKISVIGAITQKNLYFQILKRAAKQEDIIYFLKFLLRNIPGKLIIIWDRINIHRSLAVNEFINSLNGRITIEFLPPYAPELNPVEYVWGKWKRYLLPNFCPESFETLKQEAKRSLRKLKRRINPVQSFWNQARLSL
ncbi:IS630 family transposase [Leptospira santarosai]|uniref:IS630 family transposase n=1 Tax=Leptospira santarosai TaxID=28183 RepID=UPI0026464BD4|nr:IS630 family transposase [Leptospira santarosai]